MEADIKKSAQSGSRKGFTLIEAIIGIFLMGTVLLGMGQFFFLSVNNNRRSDQISNAVFLAQEKVDELRSLTSAELGALASSMIDEMLDVNGDEAVDFRRLTQIEEDEEYWRARVFIYTHEQFGTALEDLDADPLNYAPKSQLSTLIFR